MPAEILIDSEPLTCNEFPDLADLSSEDRVIAGYNHLEDFPESRPSERYDL